MKRPTTHDEIAKVIREAEFARSVAERRGPPLAGTFVRELRIRAGKTLRATAAELGVSPTHLGEIERGRVALSDSLRARMAEVLPGFDPPPVQTLRTVQSDWPQGSTGIGDASAV